jgi:hypothetical protein
MTSWGRQEREAKENSRKLILETRKEGLRNSDMLKEVSTKLHKHVSDEEDTFKEMFEQIRDSKCPKSETISLLEGYNKEQNGHLNDLADLGRETSRKLDNIINQTKGADKEIEKEEKRAERRLNNKKFYIAFATCVFLGISTLTGLVLWLKKDVIMTVERKAPTIEKHE